MRAATKRARKLIESSKGRRKAMCSFASFAQWPSLLLFLSIVQIAYAQAELFEEVEVGSANHRMLDTSL